MTTIVDGLTHVLPPYFFKRREHVLASDRTFADLFANPKAKIVGAGALIEEMDRSGVARSVIAGFGWTDLDAAMRSNDYILESAALHPERLIPVCSVNPLWDEGRAVAEAQRCFEGGSVGIGELHADTQGWVDSDPEILCDLMSEVRRYNGVTTIHGSETFGHQYPGKGTMSPTRLLSIAERYPDNRFVFSHFGGGMATDSLVDEVKHSLRNVWFDAAAAPFLYDPEVYQTAFSEFGASRILFASDFPLIRQRRALAHMEEADLDPEVAARILGMAWEVYDFKRSDP